MRPYLMCIYTIVLVMSSVVVLSGQQLKEEQASISTKNVTTAALSASSIGAGISSELDEPNTNGKKRKRFNLQPIYPNPVNNICYLFIDWYDAGAKATAELKIYDVMGTSIKDITSFMSAGTSESGTKVEIPVADLPTGMYLVVLSSAESLARSRPLIIIR
jgi:hypothetical protein